MASQYTETERLILEAARKVFLDKGFDGATMQMIATEARINKALLHYYFRSKDRLFEGVFNEAFGKMIPDLMKIFASEAPFDEKIRTFVHAYISAFQNYPQIPLFILHEIHRNPGRIIELIRSTGMNPDFVLNVIRNEIKNGNIRDIDPMQLITNMMALCIFPFAARPLIQGFIFNNKEEVYNQFLENRKTEAADFIIKAIKP